MAPRGGRAGGLAGCAALLLLACCAAGQRAGQREGAGGGGGAAAAAEGNAIRYAKELAARADPLMIVASALGDWGSSSSSPSQPSGGAGGGAGSGGKKAPAPSGGGGGGKDAQEKRAALDRAKAARELTRAEREARERREREEKAAAEAREREGKARREREERDRKERGARDKKDKEEKERKERELREKAKQGDDRKAREDKKKRDTAERERARQAASRAPPASAPDPKAKRSSGWGFGSSAKPAEPPARAGLADALARAHTAVHAAVLAASAPLAARLAEARAAVPSCASVRGALWGAAARQAAAVCARPGLARACAAAAALTGNDLVLLTLLVVLGLASYTLVAATTPQAKLYYAPTPKNGRILAGCPSLLRGFRPAPALLSGHAQTFSVLLREGPCVVYDREMVPTRDGGYVTLDWLSRTSKDTSPHAPGEASRAQQAILVVLHGLTGGSHEAYVRGAAECAAHKGGMRAVVMNCRGCAGASLFTPQAYSAAWTNDVRVALAHIRARWPDAPLFGLGYSLGANILAKYLGEDGPATPLAAACAVSNPYELAGSNRAMHRGLGPLYDRVLARGLVRTFAAHRAVLERRADLPAWGRVAASETVLEFDDRHTRRCFGYESVEHYYREGSCARVCGGVGVPLLLLVAEDDHLLDVSGMHLPELAQSNPNIVAAVTRRGGHVAWHECVDGRAQQWAEAAALQFLASALAVGRDLP